MDNKIEIGSVVYSIAGRDSQSCFIVFEIINENYVLIVDGDKHKISKPKMKKVKHLKYRGDVLTNLKEKISEKKQIFDSEIKKALKQYEEKDDKKAE
jgi:ribosomal protein L14E/L6E/L27E